MENIKLIPRLKRYSIKFMNSENIYCEISNLSELIKTTICNFSNSGLCIEP